MANGKLARWLHLGHRWLGIALGLMVLLWFVSGLVMPFVTRPQLDEAERLAGLPNCSKSQGIIERTTRGSTGVVAA